MNAAMPVSAILLLAVATSPALEVELVGGTVHTPDEPVQWTARLRNPSALPAETTLSFSLQRNPQNREGATSTGDGAGGAQGDGPDAGEVLLAGERLVRIPAGQELEVPLVERPLTTGAYFLSLRLASGDLRQQRGTSFFVMPPPLATLPADSPFGMNGASFDYPSRNRTLGVGWMRFENLKWQMSMPEPGRYAFDGSVAPWRVHHDDYLRRCRDQGMQVLPYVFQTPRWLSRAPQGTAKNVAGHPPRDFADYGEMMFQLAARYGRVKHPVAALKTADGLSGLGLLDTYQLWNEPNLEGPDWAPWVGTMAEYFELFRMGAEGVKRADPAARVAPAGIAGIGVERVDGLYRYRYADGRRPVDFADILCVHYYSGKQWPETATLDRNATRSGQAEPGAPTYPESLRQLMDWRNDHAPGKPVWITETGNDVGGPMGLGEWEQGAKIPRVVMLALAAGVEKVFIYREKGSTPAQHAGAGLMREDDTYRPAWFTYATLIRQFVGVEPGRAWRLEHPDPDVWIHVWMRAGKPLVTAWTVGKAVDLGLDLGSCVVVDAFGHAERRDARTVRLGAYPCYIGEVEKPETLRPLVASARQREAAREAARQQEAKRRATLFDFGSKDHVAVRLVGRVRAFQPVVAEDRYEVGRGWGFEGDGGTSDRFAHWMADPLRKDRVRMERGRAFRFRTEAGRYRVTLHGEALGNAVEVALRGTEPKVSWTVDKRAEPYEAEVTLPGGDLWLEANGWVELQGLALVEMDRN